MSLYTREEIEEFVANNLEIIGEYDAQEVERIRYNFADTIALLPAVHQSILIETQRQNITGDYQRVQQLYKDKQGTMDAVNGFFSPGAFGKQQSLTGHFNCRVVTNMPVPEDLQGKDVIVWSDNARGEDGRITARHEHGHRVDYLIGRNKYWSDTHQGWRDAVFRQIKTEKLKVEGINKKTPLTWLQKQVMEVSGPLYEHARELLEHLNLYESDESYAREAMAEISNHHYSLYALYEGNEEKVDEIMSRKYPELWPIYRDEYMPAAQEYSDRLQNTRHEAIDNFMFKRVSMCKLSGEELDETEAARQAGLAAARGTLAKENIKLNEKLNIYKNPIEWYQVADRALQKAKWTMAQDGETVDASNEFDFDKAASEQRAKDIMESQGFTALINAQEALTQEKKLLQRLEWAYHRQEETYARLEGRETSQPWGNIILDRFNELMEQGGFDRVQEEIDYAALPTKAVIDYASAVENLERDRLEMQYREDTNNEAYKNYQFDLDKFYSELDMMRGPYAKEEIQEATQNVNTIRQSLRKCETTLDTFASKLDTAFGFEIESYTGPQVLEKFDELWQQGGRKAIYEQTQWMYLKQSDLNTYVTMAENLAEQYWELQYGTADRQTQLDNPLKHDHQGMLEEIKSATRAGRKATLTEKTEQLKELSRQLRRLEHAYNTFDENMGVLTDTELEYTDGNKIIDKFQELIGQGGKAAIDEEVERLRVPVGALRRYISAVDAVEYCRWEVQYPTDVRRKANPYQIDKAGLIANVQSMLGDDVEQKLVEKTAELRSQHRALLKLANDYDNAVHRSEDTKHSITLNTLLSDQEYFSEQLSMASWQIRSLNNIDLSESFYEIAKLLTSERYSTNGLPASGPHTLHQQNGFTLRDLLGGAIGRVLHDGALNNDQYGGLKSWQRLRSEINDLAGDDPELIKLFKSFEVNLFEAAANKHRRVTSLAQSADPIASKHGERLLAEFDLVQSQLKENMFTQLAAADTGAEKQVSGVSTTKPS